MTEIEIGIKMPVVYSNSSRYERCLEMRQANMADAKLLLPAVKEEAPKAKKSKTGKKVTLGISLSFFVKKK